MQNKKLLTMTTTALFIALGVLMPTFFHAIGLGVAFSPMHLTVFICGMMCGWFMGTIAGILTPLISSLLTGMPPSPTVLIMIFELGTYGFLSGLLLGIFKKTKAKNFAIPLSLILAMIAGRLIYGAVGSLVFLIRGNPMTFSIYIGSVLLNSWPGIVLQIILIPAIMYLFDRLNILAKYGFTFKKHSDKIPSSAQENEQ